MGSEEGNYIERYWRDATPQDAIREPPMVARFFRGKSEWFIGKLCGCWRDSDNKLRWGDGSGLCSTTCQVYDAPEPKYIPFTWEDREQLRGRWIVDRTGEQEYTIDDFLNDSGILYICGHPAEYFLNWRFLDTGEPVGRRIQ